MATSGVCPCDAILSISVHTFYSAMYNATSFFRLLAYFLLAVWMKTDQCGSCCSQRHPSRHEFVSHKSFHEDCFQKKFKVVLLDACMHLAERRIISGPDRWIPSSVAVTDHRIDLFIPAFWCLSPHTDWHGPPQILYECQDVQSYLSASRLVVEPLHMTHHHLYNYYCYHSSLNFFWHLSTSVFKLYWNQSIPLLLNHSSWQKYTIR